MCQKDIWIDMSPRIIASVGYDPVGANFTGTCTRIVQCNCQIRLY